MSNLRPSGARKERCTGGVPVEFHVPGVCSVGQSGHAEEPGVDLAKGVVQPGVQVRGVWSGMTSSLEMLMA